MEKKKAALHSLGCKVNSYETEAMQELLEENGYEIVPFAPGADLYVINTCSVTNIADRKSRQMLHRAKKMNPGAIVVAAGCYVQAAGEILAADPAVDLVVGNNRKKDLIPLLEAFEARRGQNEGWRADKASGEDGGALEPQKEYSDTGLADLGKGAEYEPLHISRTAEHTRACIKVQDGCNQFCSYCIIPYTRGRIRSRDPKDALAEVRTLAEKGFQEIVLTGIHLSSYGKDNGSSLLELLDLLHGVEGIRRIRLGSLEPRIITEEFAKAAAGMEKLCPHFHLSLQSGCDATLKRMNRHYTAEEYYEKCRLLRETFDAPALTTDVIVGFPQETEEEFVQTVEFLKKAALYETHIFKYSRRQGTRAAAMEGQIPEQVKNQRSAILIRLGQENRLRYEGALTGSVREVLFEESQTLDGKPYYVGHTREYVRVAASSPASLENRILPVRITGERAEGILTARQ